MPNTLFIRPLQLGDNQLVTEKQYEWAIFDVAGSLLKYSAKATLDIIDQTLMQNALEHVDIIGLLPGQVSLCTQVSVPGNQSRYVQQALPFAVEDQIAQDIDEMHLVLGEKVKSGEYNVVCVTHRLFSELYDALNDEQRVGALKAIHLDSQLTSLGDAAFKIILSAKDAHIIQDTGQGIGLKTENIIPYLDSIFLIAQGETAQNESAQVTHLLEVLVDRSSPESTQMLIAEIQQYPNVSVTVNSLHQSAFEQLCSDYFQLKKTPLNLCVGPYPLSNRSKSAWSRWRAVALIAGLGFLLQFGVFIGQGVYLDKQAGLIANEALNQYRSAVPTVRNVSVDNLPRIIQGQLNQLRTQGAAQLGFLELLGEAGYQYSVSPFKSSLVFHSITFNAQRGELLIEMHAKSFDQLESLKKAMVDAGLSAKISSAVQDRDIFKGRISVGGV